RIRAPRAGPPPKCTMAPRSTPSAIEIMQRAPIHPAPATFDVRLPTPVPIHPRELSTSGLRPTFPGSLARVDSRTSPRRILPPPAGRRRGAHPVLARHAEPIPAPAHRAARHPRRARLGPGGADTVGGCDRHGGRGHRVLPGAPP